MSDSAEVVSSGHCTCASAYVIACVQTLAAVHVAASYLASSEKSGKQGSSFLTAAHLYTCGNSLFLPVLNDQSIMAQKRRDAVQHSKDMFIL